MSQQKKVKITDNLILKYLEKGISLDFEGYVRGVSLTPLSYCIKNNKKELFYKIITSQVSIKVNDIISAIESINSDYLIEILKKEVNHKEKIEKSSKYLSILEYSLSLSRYHHEDKKILFSNLKKYINYLEKNNYKMEDVLGEESIFHSSWKQYYHIKFLLNHLPEDWIKKHLNKEYIIPKVINSVSPDNDSSGVSLNSTLMKVNAPIVFNLLLLCNSHEATIKKILNFIDLSKKDEEGNGIFHYLTLQNHPAWSELNINSLSQIKGWIIQLLNIDQSPFEENKKGQTPYDVLKKNDEFKSIIIEYQKRKLEENLNISNNSKNMKRVKI